METIDYAAIVPGPGIRFGIRIQNDCVTSIDFLPPETRSKTARAGLAADVAAQITAYLQDPHFVFHMPLAASGTAFQNRVWAAISAIPCGKVRTYKALASDLTSAPRAVGGACGANPFPLVVPCHRVVSAAGIGGFANHTGGFLLDFKHWLLRHEGVETYAR